MEKGIVGYYAEYIHYDYFWDFVKLELMVLNLLMLNFFTQGNFLKM